jgi:fructosamine-3-kinase
MWTAIAQHISATTGTAFSVDNHHSVGGGCINQAYQITQGTQAYFLKVNQASQIAMFEAEALGLKDMYASQTIRVPKPICWGTADDRAYLVLEWLDLGSSHDSAWGQMGKQLAAMHRVNSDRGFGWHQTNTIGATPQPNPWTKTWLEFYQEHRLRHQFRLAGRRGGHFPRQHEILMALPDLLAGHTPTPALVHGDLWSGNAAVTRQGEPVILDPATYYGDREVDIAMTELFGRFPAAFYESYQAAYPLDEGYTTRKTLYNLYHILNHFNLFGGSYQSQSNRMIDQLLR